MAVQGEAFQYRYRQEDMETYMDAAGRSGN
jgi:hypothetical protein